MLAIRSRLGRVSNPGCDKSARCYDVDLLDGPLKGLNNIRIFSIDNLPETISLGSILSIFRLQVSVRMLGKPFFNYLEGVFSSIFFNYVSRHLADIAEIPGADLVRYAVVEAPFKKFKSAIPFLLCESRIEGAYYAAAAEIAFSIFGTLDDLCDNRLTRHSTITVLGLKGRRVTAAFMFTVLQALRRHRYLFTKARTVPTASLVTALLTSAIAQNQRFENRDFVSLEHYLANASRRTEFLKLCWLGALKMSAVEEEGQLIKSLYPKLAQLGQILNDYYDMQRSPYADADTPPEFTDIHNQTINYYVIRLLAIASKKDRRTLVHQLWGRNGSKVTRVLKQLMETYQLHQVMKQEIENRVSQACGLVTSSSMSSSKQALMILWITTQFTKPFAIVDTDDVIPKIKLLISVTEALTPVGDQS